MTGVIIMIIAIIISIISSVIKAQQRKAAQDAPVEHNGGNTYSDPWEELLHEAETYKEFPEANRSDDMTTFTSDKGQELLDAERLIRNREDEVNRRRQARHPNGKRIPDGSSDEIAATDDAAQSPLSIDDFNLRDAVIYSEILKPKF